MEKENDISSSKEETLKTSNEELVQGKKSVVSKKGLNLLKRSKPDLLRLLSILEGELEARDIFISTLQAQISNQRNARQQYFVHRLSDPFLALHRDDYTSGTPNNDKKSSEELGLIEPLPLLEKVVYQFKTQQQKMHQQMALASKIHRKMAQELAEEKRKHYVDTKTGDDVTMALEKERERLRAGVFCERARTKRIEVEYKKLLELCKQDRKKHKMIVLMLLEEQQRLILQLKESRELQIDLDSSETELQARLHEALKEKHELATRLREQHDEHGSLKTQVRSLQDQIDKLKLMQKSTNSTMGFKYPPPFTSNEFIVNDEVAPELPDKVSRNFPRISEDDVFEAMKAREEGTVSPIMGKHHPMSVAQSSQDVTLIQTSSHPPILLAGGVEEVTTSGYYSLKPGSSIAGLDAMKSAVQSKEILNMEPPLDTGSDVIDGWPEGRTGRNKSSDSLTLNLQPQPPSSNGPPKPNRFVPSSSQYPSLRSPHSIFMERNLPMTSSPTSGAANFAMNSPNSPTPPHNSPFAITRSPSVKAKPTHLIPDNPNKGSLPKNTKETPSTGKSPIRPVSASSQFQAARLKFQGNSLSQYPSKKEIGTKKNSKENMQTEEKKFQIKKISSPSSYKSHITQKVLPANSSLPNVTKQTESKPTVSEPEKIKPLPPKTRPSTAPASTEQTRPPPLPPKKPSLSSDKSVKRPEGKKQEVGIQRKTTSVKRPGPPNNASKIDANSNNSNNNNNNKRVKGPIPPSLPMKMSSQQPVPPANPRQPMSATQRLFPSPGGASGQPLSPITHSTPKTPNVFFGK